MPTLDWHRDASSQQLCLQLLNLLFVLAQESIFGVLVDARLVLDVLGPVCIAQRAGGGREQGRGGGGGGGEGGRVKYKCTIQLSMHSMSTLHTCIYLRVSS